MWNMSPNTTKVLFLAAASIALVFGALAALEVPTDLSAMDFRLARVRSLLGLFFLAFPLWAWFKASDSPARPLAVFGLTFGFLLMGAPYFESAVVRGVLDGMGIFAVFAGLAALVHFLLAFPFRRSLLDRQWAPILLYGPAAVVVLVSIGMLNLSFGAGVRNVLGILTAVVSGAYLLAAVLLLIWRYSIASRPERATHGLSMMLMGTLAAVVPVLLYPVIVSMWPDSARYYRVIYSTYSPPLTLALIPITFSLAAVRSAQSRAEVRSTS